MLLRNVMLAAFCVSLFTVQTDADYFRALHHNMWQSVLFDSPACIRSIHNYDDAVLFTWNNISTEMFNRYQSITGPLSLSDNSCVNFMNNQMYSIKSSRKFIPPKKSCIEKGMIPDHLDNLAVNQTDLNNYNGLMNGCTEFAGCNTREKPGNVPEPSSVLMLFLSLVAFVGISMIHKS